MLAYNFITFLLLIPLVIWFTDRGLKYSLIILAVPYLIGFVYISIIWSLANVVSLLEDLKGYNAIKKSKALLKGKRLLASSLFVLIFLPVVVVQIAFLIIDLVVYEEGLRWLFSPEKVGTLYAILTSGLILLVLIPLGLIIQTIVYFVCKSYHHESIDKSYLANRLEFFLPAAAQVQQVETNV
ncbi:hypothetical protein AQUCO_04400064v1 [Aquilegia coerulea]|uniref:Uncharacterized protein n=1 Tax=Aquilegia coerulea TaxID=218851 RepID=A0A2G5CMU6_AQUCA|nr:hypothetical protein AQUCO_04400064v1 [Aquilegia coerulea]